MNILSLFDGMSCGQIALNRAGIEYNNYYASEIDKYAIKVTQSNYPDTIQLGDIQNWKQWQINKPDLIIFGSPCQGFSFAGLGLNFNDPRSKLFFTAAEILKYYHPKWFLMENVVMKAEHIDVISALLGEIYPECIKQTELFRPGRLEPKLINSALVSAQNRERLYWTNILIKGQPEDKGILLKDIIENGYADRDKSVVLDSGYYKTSNSNPDRYERKSGRQIIYSGCGGNQEPKTAVRQSEKCQDCRNANRKELTDKANSLLASVYKGEAANGCTIINDNITWRKLTPIECERLQTVPDNYANCVSNIQRYKMLGNGWTVDIIAWILSFIII